MPQCQSNFTNIHSRLFFSKPGLLLHAQYPRQSASRAVLQNNKELSWILETLLNPHNEWVVVHLREDSTLPSNVIQVLVLIYLPFVLDFHCKQLIRRIINSLTEQHLAKGSSSNVV